MTFTTRAACLGVLLSIGCGSADAVDLDEPAGGEAREGAMRSAAAAPRASDDAVTSVFTSLDVESCESLAIDPGDDGRPVFPTWECRGVGAFRLRASQFDGRTNAFVVAGDSTTDLGLWDRFVMAGHLGDRAEWRVAGEPFAVLFAYREKVEEGGHAWHDYVIVAKLGEHRACLSTVVDAAVHLDGDDAARERDLVKAGETARRAADETRRVACPRTIATVRTSGVPPRRAASM
jgi:hypothetical protein